MIEFNATFIVAMLSFVLFILIMNSIFYNPILSIIRKRDEYINSNYSEAKTLKDTAQSLNEEREIKLNQTKENCRQNLMSVVDKVQSDAGQKIKIARDHSKAAIQTGKDNVHAKEEEVKNKIKTEVINDLASSIVSKITGIQTVVDSSDDATLTKIME